MASVTETSGWSQGSRPIDRPIARQLSRSDLYFANIAKFRLSHLSRYHVIDLTATIDATPIIHSVTHYFTSESMPLNTATPGTFGILLLTVIISLMGLYSQPKLVTRYLFRPYYLVRDRQYYTLISSGLVHGNGSHLLFNMLSLYFFGPLLESAVGTTRFVVLYVLALVLSEARTYWQEKDNPNYASLGASGAVSAVLFASIVYFPNQSILILPIPFPIPAPLFAVCYLAYSWHLARRGGDGINHNAHIDGAITGLLFVALTDIGAYQRLFALVG
jgi:membrane associated rhomboid family serine protease